MEEIKIRELPEKENINPTDYVIIEDDDGTKKSKVRHLRSLVLNSLYFNNIEELKTSARNLKEGDICETLGYYEPGDGGRALYRITYNPGAVEDGMFIHYLSYSDTLRAELIIGDVINVQQFGAKGDGKHDDTLAIQTAINNATQKTIEFTHNKTYLTKKTINIRNSNLNIQGNGAILFPQYVHGLNIIPINDNADPIHDITINNLNFDCAKAISAINGYKIVNMNIRQSIINNITDRGIRLSNCVFINIENSEFSNKQTGSCIVIDGTDLTDKPSLSCRLISIDKCKFTGFNKAIYIKSTGNANATGLNTITNITNCHYYSTEANSFCIYIASNIESVDIKANTCEGVDTFLFFGGASSGNVSCRDISCLGTKKVFDIGTSLGILHLDGNINADASAVMFENMVGKLHSNVAWDGISSPASFNNAPIGELFDIVDPMIYSDRNGYSIAGGKLTLRGVRNMNVNWSSTVSNLKEIANGVKGQLIFLKSSTGKAIESTINKIELKDQYVQLGAYNGMILKYDGLKWVQLTTDGTESGGSDPSVVTPAKSVYDLWLELGNTGSAGDFMKTLKGTEITDIATEINGKILKFKFYFSNGSMKEVSATLP